MIDGTKIEAIVNQYLENTDIFLVEVNIRPGNRVQVLIDGDKGVKISDCALLTRHIEANYNREPEDYYLEVSSVGVGSPLKLKRQYPINIGRNILIIGNDLQKTTGRLIEVIDEGIRIEMITPSYKKKAGAENMESVFFLFSAIKEARIQVSFE
ncbi:MAG TPA: ribosome assembly cofactor RimP [Bacteroidales bacterium]|nr:ribosome assembly cofactor RimP [Bacteroidales bacterium]